MLKVSVFIVTRNRLELLKRAVESVRQQTYQNIEMIIVNDASTDKTEEWLTSLEQSVPNVTVIHLAERKGLSCGRNLAIGAAGGDFLTGLDDDDVFLPGRVKEFVCFWEGLDLAKQKVAGIFSNYETILVGGGRVKSYVPKEVDRQLLFTANLVRCAVFAPKENYLRAGLYDVNMPTWEDWEFNLRLARYCGVFFNVENHSYIIDASHSSGRMAFFPESTIKSAYNLLISKNEDITSYQRSKILNALLNSPRVKTRFIDLVQLCLAKNYYDFLKHLLFKIFTRQGVLNCLHKVGLYKIARKISRV